MQEKNLTPRRRGVATVQCKYLLLPEARDLVVNEAERPDIKGLRKTQSQIIEDLIFAKYGKG